MSITQPGQPGYGAGSGAPHVMLAFLKHLWTQGQRTEAYSRIKDLVRCKGKLSFIEANVCMSGGGRLGEHVRAVAGARDTLLLLLVSLA